MPRPKLAVRNRDTNEQGQVFYKGVWSNSFHSWRGMIERCSNPNSKSFKNYGGRGISVCSRWKSFADFVSDMGERPSLDHSIERIRVNEGYSPENCV